MNRHPTIMLALFIGLLAHEVQAGDSTTRSVVEIIRQSDGHIGAGVHIEGKYILTAAHVVRNEQYVTVKDDQGRAQRGRVVRRNFSVDVALVTIEIPAYIQISSLRCKNSPRTQIYMIGHPLGRTFTRINALIISSEMRLGAWDSLMLLNRGAPPGMSGGPVFNQQGQLVGMVASNFQTRSHRNVAGMVPLHSICQFMYGQEVPY